MEDEVRELRERVARLESALTSVAYLLSQYGVTSPGSVRDALAALRPPTPRPGEEER